jgi:hypothetical protein
MAGDAAKLPLLANISSIPTAMGTWHDADLGQPIARR